MNSYSTDTWEIRRFGLIAFVFFGCLGGLLIWREKNVFAIIFGVFSLTGLAMLLFPSPLKPVYLAWLKTTAFIGKVLTVLILTLAYYAVITPFGLVKRIFGGRPLPVRPDPEASSYWISRSEASQPRERFKKRF